MTTTFYQNIHSVYMAIGPDEVVEIDFNDRHNMTVGDMSMVTNGPDRIYPVTECTRDVFYEKYLYWQKLQSETLQKIEKILLETK